MRDTRRLCKGLCADLEALGLEAWASLGPWLLAVWVRVVGLGSKGSRFGLEGVRFEVLACRALGLRNMLAQSLNSEAFYGCPVRAQGVGSLDCRASRCTI